MKPVLIDNGKDPDETYHASLGFWLPPKSLYGNFTLKLMKICNRIDEANRRLTESCAFWEQTRTDGIYPPNAFQRHIYANEQTIYLLRRAADEMISLIWCLSEWQTKRDYPKEIKVDCIGALLKASPEQQLTFYSKHIHMLTLLNEIANAFKHSFIDSDINIIGRDEPCVYALSLDHNRLASEAQLHSVSLAWLAKAYTAFYKDGMDWLRAFSEQHRPQPVKEQVEHSRPPNVP